MYALNFSPFHYLSESQQQYLKNNSNIAFFHDGAVVLQANDSVEYLYVVIKGLVRENTPDGEVVALYQPNDSFDARMLIEGKADHLFVVEEQALLYLIPRQIVQEMIVANPRFGAYCYSNLADKFQDFSEHNHGELTNLFTAKVADVYHKNTAWLNGDETAFNAAKVMKERKTKSLLIRHNHQIGILTESIFRDMLLQHQAADTPIHQLATFSLITVDSDDFLFSALLEMVRHRVQRVVVCQNGNVVGTLEQIDVLAYVSNHSHLIAQRLETAHNLDELEDLSLQMTETVRLLRKSGVRAPQLAQLMQVLNTQLFEKIWRFIAPAYIYEQSCLLVMGSEGRGEQVLKTDQDNALILNLDNENDVQLAEQATEQFSQALSRLGYPPCAGNIMVTNPYWRKNVDEFKHTIRKWCMKPTPENMMYLAIFIDAKVVAGDERLFHEVKQYLNKFLNNDAGMLMTFARATEQFEQEHSGFFAKLLHKQPQSLDIKKMGQFPIVHGIRSLSLEAHIEETNTFTRIKKLIALGVLEPELGRDVSEALSYLMDLRFKANLAIADKLSSQAPNQLDIKSLSTLERDLLKDALSVVKRFKSMIHNHFRLGNQ